MTSWLLTLSFISIAQAEQPAPSDTEEETTDGESTPSDRTSEANVEEGNLPVEPDNEETSIQDEDADVPATNEDDTQNNEEIPSTTDKAIDESTDESTDETTDESQVEPPLEDIEDMLGTTSPELEALMNDIMQEIAESEEGNFEDRFANDNEEEEEDDDESFNYKGNLEYSYILTIWDSPTRHIFHTAQVSGDPQYFFNHNDRWGPTLGMRFQVSATENLEQRYLYDLVGLTTGLQVGSFRVNTSASWMWEQYFAQTETDRNTEDELVTYQYDELSAMSGILWENTLTYSPEELDIAVQASVGFPFQVNGSREMGETFTGSWQASSRVNISLFQLGYTHIVYPNHILQRVQIGTGILF